MGAIDYVALLRLIYEGEQPEFTAQEASACLATLEDDHESTLPLIWRLLSTGTDSGKERVRKLVRSALSIIRKERSQSHLVEDWKGYCDFAFYPSLSKKITRAWNVANVVEEVGNVGDYSVNDYASVLRIVEHHRTKVLDAEYAPDAILSDEIWRGITALKMSGMEYVLNRELRHRAQVKDKMKFYEDSLTFINWAGSHSDISSVIITAAERQTIAVDLLKMIIEPPIGSPAISAGSL